MPVDLTVYLLSSSGVERCIAVMPDEAEEATELFTGLFTVFTGLFAVFTELFTGLFTVFTGLATSVVRGHS